VTDEELRSALSALSGGGVVAAATETFFGLLADARCSDAVDRVLSLKGRDAKKGLALLIPHRQGWSSLVTEIPALAAQLADRFWPGPLTIALAARANLDPRLTVDGNVAVRWPGPSDAARIVAAFGSPLTATSANRSGQPACTTSGEVERTFAGALGAGELVRVPGRAAGGAGSTLVAVVGDRVRIVRSGRIQEGDIRSVVPTSALG
jgi:L-threonylcarbamoyladenylate synthase